MAFLNSELNAKVSEQLEGFVVPSHEKKVCKLVKSFNRLEQAAKQW